MTNITRCLSRRLKRKVNETKSAVARPEERKFLRFSFSNNKEPKRRVTPKVLLRCKEKIRELTRRTRGISLEQMLKELTAYSRGWKSYFGFCQTPRYCGIWITGSAAGCDPRSGSNGSMAQFGSGSFDDGT
jgi:RNA-directed DNA polymerase